MVAALAVVASVVLVCAFSFPASRGASAPVSAPAPRERHVAPDGRELAHDGRSAGADTLVFGAGLVAVGAVLGLCGLVCHRPRHETG
ncbi:hypothetical protein [Streptomyces telluris]|uniref:Uncharacterized protein n=1 Tax=Streptomyces telluris TaxID=2720021 RepID=A0A9X2LGD0_9ACTN|nr:hypothetical protein [Streptomyces telluris]MCQ8770663.1 hypothetical protein [Streptomyces telluris]NJP77629.1 hypothetical protein [Streptomyces telluris]